MLQRRRTEQHRRQLGSTQQLHDRPLGHRLGRQPGPSDTPGGGSGGAIYTDGDNYNVVIADTIVRDDNARAGGGVFFVVDNDGTLTIKGSHAAPQLEREFFTASFLGIFFHSSGDPLVADSTIN